MKKILLSIIGLSVLIASQAKAQPLNPGEWRTYTSMRSVQDLVLSPDSVHVWAVTSGGAFRANIRDTNEPLFVLRTTDGLTENDLTAVAADARGNIFFGGRTGGFDVYRAATGTVEKLGSDIVNSDHPVKTINAISTSGDTVFLSTAYGIGVYKNANPGYFLLTVGTIGSLPPSDSVAQVIDAGGYVYAAMHEGVVYANNKIDLYSNSNWVLTPDTGGSVRCLAQFDGTIYVGASNGLFKLSADRQSLSPVILPAVSSVIRIAASRDSLFILDATGTVYSTHDLVQFASHMYSSPPGGLISDICPTFDQHVVVGSSPNGIAIPVAGALLTDVFPPGPINNQIGSLSYASSNDHLYVSTGIYGLAVFNPEVSNWRTYVGGAGTTPNGNFSTMTYDSIRNVTWVGNLGAGFYKVGNLGSSEPPVWTTILQSTHGIPSFDVHSDFAVTRGGLIDRAGRFIMPNWAENGHGLIVTEDGNTFSSLQLNDPTPPLGLPYGCVTEDLEGNYWVGTIRHDSPKSYGVFWYRSSDGARGSIAGGPQLQLDNAAVNAILTDQDDGIWCGTEGGVQIISNPYAINQPDPKFSIRKVPLLSSQIVSCMAVDGVGNKWIGTENGVFVVSPDGSDSVAHFSKENSPLVDNKVTSIAIDAARGEAYIGTFLSGISRFSTIFKQGNPDYKDIRVFPNPVVQNEEENPLIHIDGLVAGSTVKVFTLNMKLVASINGTNLGSTVTWSGRDDAGRQVPSGMYLITATSAQSGDNGQAKVVIVRKP